MKNIITLLAITIISFSVMASDNSCVLDEANVNLSTLAKEVDATCDWTIKKVVARSILKECEEADEALGIMFTNSSKKVIRFSEYNLSYNVNEPFFYCKNKKGYEAYFSHFVSILSKEVHDNNRAKYEKHKHSRNPINNHPKSDKIIVSKWRCIVPHYLRIARIYTADEKELLDLTHLGNPKYTCWPIM